MPRRRSRRLARFLAAIARAPAWFRWPAFGLLWLSSVALLHTVPMTAGPALGLGHAVYAALGLFALDAPSFPAPDQGLAGVALWAMMFLAPALTATAAADVIHRHRLSPELRAAGLDGHVVIASLGHHGRALARLARERGDAVAGVDKNVESLGERVVAGLPQAVALPGDMTDVEVVRAAGVGRASHVFPAVVLRLAQAIGTGDSEHIVAHSLPEVFAQRMKEKLPMRGAAGRLQS